MKKSVTILIGLLYFSFLHAQEVDFLFKHLSIEDGLSESTVHAIYQDSYGFMWFGTDAGLNKFDGYEFTLYQHDPLNANSLVSNFIVSVFEDSYGYFWVGSGYDGLNRIDRKKETIFTYTHHSDSSASLSSNYVRDIFEDSKNTLWIATAGGGISIYNREKDNFKQIRHDSSDATSLPSNYISTIVEDKTGNIWMSSTEGFIISFNSIDSTFKTIDVYKGYRGDLFNTTFCQLYVDSNNDIWFCTELGLFQYKQANQAMKHYKEGPGLDDLNSNNVSSILEYQKDIYLIATDHGGLNILNTKTGRIDKYLHNKFDDNSLSNNQLYTIYRSSDSIIWIGSFMGGMNYFDKKSYKFAQLQNLLKGKDKVNCCGSVSGIVEDKNGKIWLGYDGNGIEIFDPVKNKIVKRYNTTTTKEIGTDIITSLYADSKEDIWIGTYLDGMYKFNWQTESFTHFINNPRDTLSIHGNNIWCMAEEDDEYLWIGTMGEGLGLFNKSGVLVRKYQNNPEDETTLSNSDVFAVLIDSKNNLWVGTRSGLNKYNREKEEFIRYEHNTEDISSLLGNWVAEIMEDSEGNIWIGTDWGLNKYRSETDDFIHFDTKDGIGGIQVFNILEDNRGNLWVTTNNGITVFNPENLTFRNYGVSDGLQGAKFNYTTSLIDSRGNFYFAGTNGYNVFKPDQIKHNTIVPRVFITDIKVLNKSLSPIDSASALKKHINFANQITLSYKENIITLRFAALNFTNSANNQYQYRLHNFDRDWVHSGTRREVTYTNLDPGKYLFEVKGSNNDGLWNDTSAKLEIIVTPPFWKTLLFRVLVILFMLFIFYLILVFQTKKVKKQKIVLAKMVSERTNELNAANLQLTEINEELKASRDELSMNKATLEQTVVERTKELILAKEKAEESDRLKTSFITNMSHEIRTPLNAIVGFSSMINDPEFSEDEKQEFRQNIMRSSETLTLLVDDILDLSLIETGQIQISPVSFSLNSFLSDIYAEYKVHPNAKHIEVILKNHSEGEDLYLFYDVERVKQVLNNLFSNACKFTEKGFVEIGFSHDKTRAEFYVKDTGIGISDKNIDVIFNRFRKIEDNTTKLYRGNGLGLAVSLEFAKIMDGRLWVESEVNNGSIFYFQLPFVEGRRDLGGKKVSDSPILMNKFEGKKVLVVEDEETNYQLIEKILRPTGCEIIWTENGKKAVELFKANNTFDIVLMDLKMPVMDGYTACKHIKELFPNQKILAVTAYAFKSDHEKIANTGFNGYVAKPLNIRLMLEEINKHL